MNRNQIIKDSSTKKLREEIEELVRISAYEKWEEPWDEETAFEHIEDLADEDYWAEFKRPCLKVRIALGDYAPISEEKGPGFALLSGDWF